MGRLILVRHGETALNLERRYQGRIDAPLTERGRAQAARLRAKLEEALGHDFRERPTVQVHVSSAERARATAAIALPGRPHHVDDRLRELDFGVFDGATYEENLRTHGARFQAWIADPARVRPAGGETLPELEARVSRWLDSLPPGEDVIAFTHGGPIRAAISQLSAAAFESSWSVDVAPGEVVCLSVPDPGLRNQVYALERWLARLGAGVAPADRASAPEVLERLDQLTKPIGSLGRLERLALRLARMCGDPPPAFRRRAVVVLAADHGVASRGVSAYPAEVTAQMCRNYAAGGAAINALARAVAAEVVAVDVGVAADPATLGILSRKVRWGSADLSTGPAMTRSDALRAVRTGAALVEERLELTDVFALGEMGIGSSTAAAALTAALTGAEAEAVVGTGTGVDPATVERKRDIVRAAVARIPPGADPVTVLSEVGGLEIAGLAGVVLAAARAGRPVVTDGFIATAAVLVAARIAPSTVDYVIASHRSVEPGHGVQLTALGLEPLLDLELRLGEGTGAALALPIVDAAGGVLREMATFADAGVSRARDG